LRENLTAHVAGRASDEDAMHRTILSPEIAWIDSVSSAIPESTCTWEYQ
jgi:hypothetical protein